MGLYLFIIKVYAASRITARFINNGDAVYHAGLMATLQTFLLLISGGGVVALLYSGVFLFTLWLGLFRLLTLIDRKPVAWTFVTLGLAVPFIAQF